MTRGEFSQIIEKINAADCWRKAGQVTPSVCAAWREGGQVKRVVEAVIAWEVCTRPIMPDGTRAPHESGSIATPADMEAVLTKRLAFEREQNGTTA